MLAFDSVLVLCIVGGALIKTRWCASMESRKEERKEKVGQRRRKNGGELSDPQCLPDTGSLCLLQGNMERAKELKEQQLYIYL